MYITLLDTFKNTGSVKKSLTVKPFVPDDYNVQEYKVYKRHGDLYCIPLFYPLKTYENTVQNISFGEKRQIEFLTELREYQKEPANIVFEHLKQKKSGLCCVYTGWGKTCLALWIASKLKVKTLIIVHTGALLEQWRERVLFFNGIEPGIYRQKSDFGNASIVIGTVQSILRRNYDLSRFGFLIIDETHMYPTKYFSKIFYEIPCLYTLGLTATLERKDKLDKVIKWFLGDVIVNIDQLSHTPTIRFEYFTSALPIEETLNKIGKVNQSRMLTELCEHLERTNFIIDIIKNLLKDNRKILLLSHRRTQCEFIYKQLGDSISGLYLGGMSNDELEKTNEKSVILATYNMASMGYDNKKLDTLVFASPRSSIKQCVGRILRQLNVNSPLVVDIIDAYSIFLGLFNQRKRYYKKNKFVIENDNVSKKEKVKLPEKCLL